MSVVINGMEMPISCPHCPCSDDESRFCRAANKYIPMLGKPEFCPLVTIEVRKKGKWKEEIDTGERMLACSACGGRVFLETYETAVGEHGYRFCPYCGSRMER